MNSPTLDPETWLDEHGDALYAYAMLRINNAATSEDLVQDTLIAGINALDQFKQGASIRTWLISILKNKIIDHLRKANREVPFENDLLDDDPFSGKFGVDNHWITSPGEWANPERQMENTQLGEKISRCLDELPEKLRTLIFMRDVDGIETDELVEVLGISSNANLWTMLSRGREKVRACIDRAM